MATTLIALAIVWISVAALSALTYLWLGRALGCPPLRIDVGWGPRLAKWSAGPTVVEVRAVPLAASASYREEDRRAVPPGFFARALLSLAPIGLLFVVALAILGPAALQSLVHGFPQVLDLMWPFGDGSALVTCFAAHAESWGLTHSIGILATKQVAAAIVFTAIQPFLWFGGRTDESPGWTGILIFAAPLCAIGAAINIVRGLS